MAELICIVCPKGCHLNVDEKTLTVKGNACPRGEEYGKNELTNPVRVITSTVRISGAQCSRVPVKTNGSIPKPLIAKAMSLLCGVEVASPVKIGDVVIKNVLDTGVDFVITRDM